MEELPFIHFDTFAEFNSKKLSANTENTKYTIGVDGAITSGSPDILWHSICWVKDKQKMWTHGRLYDCSPFVNSIEGKINLSSITEIKAAQNKLTQTNEVAYYLITDRSGRLPSTEACYDIPSDCVKQLSMRSPDTLSNSALTLATSVKDVSPIGVNVGDLIAITRAKVGVSDLANALGITLNLGSKVEIYQYKVLSTNDVKAPDTRGTEVGVMGLASPWDKQQINKIPTIESNLSTTASELNRGNKKQVFDADNYNIDRCLNAGIYKYGRTGRSMPDNHSDEYYIVDADTRYNRSDSLYYVTQKVYSVNYPNRAFERLITTTSIDNYNGTYSDWVQIGKDSYTRNEIETNYATKTYVGEQISDLVGTAPDTLDTIYELSAALKDNKDIVDVLEESIANKADKSSIPTKVSQLTNDSGYITSDDLNFSGSAEGVVFNPSGTGLASTNVQDAIAEVKEAVDNATIEGGGVVIVQEVGTSTDKVMSQKAVTDAIPKIVNDLTTGGADKALSAEMGMELKHEIGDVGGYTKLTSSDLMPMVYDGTKMASSSSYNTWVLPLIEGVTYNAVKPSYIHTIRTSAVYPSLGTIATMPVLNNLNFVATEDMKYLVISINVSKYNSEDYELEHSGYGLTQNISELNNSVQRNSQSLIKIEDDIAKINGDLGSQDYKSTKRRISLWVKDTPNIDNYLIKVDCVNPPIEKFNIFKATSSKTGLAMVVNNCEFGEYYEIQKDAEKPVLYIYYSGGTDDTVDERVYTISFKNNDNVLQKVQDLEIGLELLQSTSGWGGKSIVCFGDSITEFKDANSKSYSDYIAEITSANVINVGVGGTQFRQRAQPLITPTSDNEAYAALDIINIVKAACEQNFEKQINAASYLQSKDNNIAIIERLQSIDWSSVSAVTIFAGTNDWNNGSSSWGVSGSTDINTTLGAINEIIRLILTTYPHVSIYWFSPIVRWLTNDSGERTNETWSDNFKRNNKTLKEFSAMVVEEVSKHHIPTCDMYNTLGWNQYNFSQYFKDTDGTHPTKGRGMECIGRKITAFINANKTF